MQTYGENDVGRIRREREAGTPRARVTRALAMFCLLSALLNGVAFRDTLALKPYGRARQAWLAVAEPVATLSAWTRLNHVREFLKKRFHFLSPS